MQPAKLCCCRMNKRRVLYDVLGGIFYSVLSGVALASPASMAADSIAASTAADNEQSFAIEIAPGALANTLTDFTRQTGISVIFDNRNVGGLTSPALNGRYTAQEAMQALLIQTGLSFRVVNKQTWAIVVDPSKPAVDHGDQAVKTIDATARKLRDEIIVTASYRNPSQIAGARAFYTLDGEQMRLNGALNIAEPIFELPATVTSVSSANTALLLSSGGLNLADLRGLGPERTLVLVNGRRYIRTSGGNGNILGVDLNAIPAPFVERIEVVNQSAGAAIGMEAVAGAVNIVTREDIDGIALTLDGGISQWGDAEEYSASVLAGKQFDDDRGRIALGVAFASEPSLLAQERDAISSPYGFSTNGIQSFGGPGAVFGPGFGGSNFTPNSRLSAVVTQTGDVSYFNSAERQVIALDGGSFEPYEGRLDQLYNWLNDFSALPEIERLIGYGSGGYEISPTHKAFVEVHFADIDVGTQIASSPVSAFRGQDTQFGDAIVVPANHPDAPAGLLAAAEAIAGEPISDFLLDRRFVELGPRRRDINRRSFQVAGGIEGSLGGGWKYDVSYQYGANRTFDTAIGLADVDRLQTAIDASACALVAGCSPINIFAPSTITPSQAAFILADPRERIIKTREQIGQVRFSGPIYELRGEEGFITAGLEHRRERFEDEFLTASTAGVHGEFFIPGAFGKVALTEAYINANLPILVDVPWARFLEFGGAYRLTIRQGINEFSNFSGSARWSPIEGLEFYAQAFHGGRSPNVMEQFAAGPDIFTSFGDPCDTSNGPLSGEVAVNCADPGPLGAGGPGFVQDNALAFSERSGNPQLRQETVNSRLFGASVDVHALAPVLPGIMTISADWRRHRVTDVAVSLGFFEILERCYASTGLLDVTCGQNPVTGNRFIQRDILTRQIVEVESTLFNGGEILTSGLDARLQYLLDIDGPPLLETIALDVLYTYIHRIRSEGFRDDMETISEGLVPFPRHQIHATASIGTDELKSVWTVRRRGSAASFRDIADPAYQAPAVTYVDTAIQWRAGGNAILYAGVENLFNRDVPIVAGAPNGFYFEHYDPIGRRFLPASKLSFSCTAISALFYRPGAPFALPFASHYAVRSRINLDNDGGLCGLFTYLGDWRFIMRLSALRFMLLLYFTRDCRSFFL